MTLHSLRILYFSFTLAAVALITAASARGADSPEFYAADCCCAGPPTLFRWYCSEEEGGPPGFDEPLASDRPDFVEASTTVGMGVRQLEMGYTYFYDDDGGANRSFGGTYPEFLFRMGVFADWLELRVGWTYSTLDERSVGVSNSFDGSEDLYLGVKLGLTPQDGILPEIALVPQMTVPTGHSDFTADKVLPGFNLLYGWDISDFLSFAGSTAANMAIDDGTGDEFLEFAQAFTIGHTLTEKIGAYTEWFMITPSGAETARTQHFLDGGFIYRVTNNLQLDVRAGKGVSAGADDYFVGSGAVARW
jgi:hypothetical protein